MQDQRKCIGNGKRSEKERECALRFSFPTDGKKQRSARCVKHGKCGKRDGCCRCEKGGKIVFRQKTEYADHVFFGEKAEDQSRRHFASAESERTKDHGDPFRREIQNALRYVLCRS